MSSRNGPSFPALVREDLASHGNRVQSPGFRALLVHRFGCWRDGLGSGLPRKLLRFPYEALRRHVRARYRIELHHTAVIGRRVQLSDYGAIVIGNEAVLGDDCVVAADATMAKTKVGRPGRPRLGERVVIGPGAVFVGGVEVGDDAVVGPNAVVFTDVPARTVLLAPLPSVEARPTPWVRPAIDPASQLSLVTAADLPSGALIGDGVRAAMASPPRIEGAVVIGDGCVIHERVTVGWAPSHGAETSGSITRLGRRVELSAGVVILRGVSLGDDVWVGPNTVVETDVPPGSAVEAAPPRVFGGLRQASAN